MLLQLILQSSNGNNVKATVYFCKLATILDQNYADQTVVVWLGQQLTFQNCFNTLFCDYGNRSSSFFNWFSFFIIYRHNRGFCMLDKPRLDMIETTSPLLAGEKFPADQQCELIFGANSKVCPFQITVSIYGQQVDQVSGMAHKKPIRIQILAPFVDSFPN